MQNLLSLEKILINSCSSFGWAWQKQLGSRLVTAELKRINITKKHGILVFFLVRYNDNNNRFAQRSYVVISRQISGQNNDNLLCLFIQICLSLGPVHIMCCFISCLFFVLAYGHLYFLQLLCTRVGYQTCSCITMYMTIGFSIENKF